MGIVRMKSLTAAACLALVTATDALAWGPDGHRIVCRIAQQVLDAARQKIIATLATEYRTPDEGKFASFPEACNFADDARQKARDNVPGWDRFDPFDRWHFLNVPRTTGLVAESHCDGNCVLTGIAHHAKALASAAAPERAEALLFLGHWVGDIHQPLHISYADDLGGNEIQPINGGFYTSGHLHAVWDSGIIHKAMDSDGWRVYADRLAREITPAETAVWTGASLLAWAQESYVLATRPRAQYCSWRTTKGESRCGRITAVRTLAQAYQDEFADDVAMRLQQAGVRLADLLRRHLPVP
jgi:hypothetical protein